jgi:hypothetical protein
MNYADAYETIAKYGDTSTLAKFADTWSRWPEPYTALEIIKELKPRMVMYFGLKCTREGEAVADVIEALIDHSDSTMADWEAQKEPTS